MYCKKCGQYTDNEDGLCASCKAQDDFGFENTTTVNNEPVYTEAQQSEDRRLGLKTGIISAIFGFISTVFSGIASGIVAALIELGDFGMAIPVGIVLSIPAIVFGIIALIKGINCIKTFIRSCKAKKAKPIATLILGIVAIDFAASGLISTVLLFLLLLMLL
ncbi:MAG: hypothetical protein J6B16_05840 [Clostridia bacterium]|nr:hypothetical protein [Clostridia bacterium]